MVGEVLDWMILGVFSNLGDSIILWFYLKAAVRVVLVSDCMYACDLHDTCSCILYVSMSVLQWNVCHRISLIRDPWSDFQLVRNTRSEILCSLWVERVKGIKGLRRVNRYWTRFIWHTILTRFLINICHICAILNTSFAEQVLNDRRSAHRKWNRIFLIVPAFFVAFNYFVIYEENCPSFYIFFEFNHSHTWKCFYRVIHWYTPIDRTMLSVDNSWP